jgi:nicotinate-nucleotide adenylyltransferase
MARIGVYGGAFDPVHRAHISLATAAQNQFKLDEVLLIPTGIPPHRPRAQTADLHRLKMLDLASKNFSGLKICDWELRQRGTAYTFKTLAYLQKLPKLQNANFFLLLGEDSLRQFTSWRRWADILEMCHLCVARRPSEESTCLPEVLQERVAISNADIGALTEVRSGRVFYIDIEPIEISSTDVREQIGEGAEDLTCLDPAVMQYIRDNRLYQNA